jgi:hypothetical protein
MSSVSLSLFRIFGRRGLSLKIPQYTLTGLYLNIRAMIDFHLKCYAAYITVAYPTGACACKREN